MVETISGVFLIAGAVWSLLAAAGVLKFDDVLSRMHAGTKATTLGVFLVTLGAVPRFDAATSAKLVLVVALIYLTIPVGAHLVGRATYHERGTARIRIDTIDELAEGPDLRQ